MVSKNYRSAAEYAEKGFYHEMSELLSLWGAIKFVALVADLRRRLNAVSLLTP
jgi:hypothetical protein